MATDWQKVFSSPLRYQVELAKLLLDRHDIPTVVVNRQDSMYPSLGEIELYTPRDYVLRALHLLREQADQMHHA